MQFVTPSHYESQRALDLGINHDSCKLFELFPRESRQAPCTYHVAFDKKYGKSCLSNSYELLQTFWVTLIINNIYLLIKDVRKKKE